MKAKTKNRITTIAMACIIIGLAVSLLICTLYPNGGWRNFASLEEWQGWLAEHPVSFPITALKAAQYIQLEALENGYIVSFQVVTFENEGKEELHAGLLIELPDGYYYSELQTSGAWATVKLYGK